MRKHTEPDEDDTERANRSAEPRGVIRVSSEEDADWIKLGNPLGSMEELLIHEVLSRYRDRPEQSESIWEQMEGLSPLQKYDYITELMRE